MDHPFKRPVSRGIDIATKDLATLLAGGLSLKRGGQVVGVIDVRGGWGRDQTVTETGAQLE